MDIGYLCPYGDIDALVSILEEIKNNPNEARRKGEQGRRLFEKRFNWPLMEQKLSHIVTELIKTKSNSSENRSRLQSE
jgi:glycosyltransferase involved in cell wall biosynthesis